MLTHKSWTEDEVTLVVEGTTWEGLDDMFHHYKLKKGEKLPATYAECKALAGDFSSLSDARLVREIKQISVVTDTVIIIQGGKALFEQPSAAMSDTIQTQAETLLAEIAELVPGETDSRFIEILTDLHAELEGLLALNAELRKAQRGMESGETMNNTAGRQHKESDHAT